MNAVFLILFSIRYPEEEYCKKYKIKVIRVDERELEDVRMQNIVVIANIDKNNLIPGVTTAHYQEAMGDLLEGSVLEKNVALFESERGAE